MSRIIRPGRGRKALTYTDSTLLSDLDSLIDGDPIYGIRWTCKSVRKLAEELCKMGHKLCHMLVLKELIKQKYSLQVNRKKDPCSFRRDRDKQFAYINETVIEFQKRGDPVISIDTKENDGNSGKTWLPQKPKKVKVYDFVCETLSNKMPKGKGFVPVGIDHDTAGFAAAMIGRWWENIGHNAFPHAKNLYITAYSVGSNVSRNTPWQRALQKLADQKNISINVSHYPPGTSKWNQIEHRMCSYISMILQATPLVSREIIVDLISHTKTKTGLKISNELDTNSCKKGIVATNKEFDDMSLRRSALHDEWNYLLSPKTKSDQM